MLEGGLIMREVETGAELALLSEQELENVSGGALPLAFYWGAGWLAGEVLLR
jgi:lactobin A/cerein 7B family class IIb bacteriocin